MVTKIYGIYGRTTAIVRVPVGKGKAYIQVEFTRGVPNPGPNYRPATFSTADPVTQDILERSPLYNSMFKLYREVRSESPKAAVAKAPKKKEIEVLDGIATLEEAITYLKSKGAKATNLKDSDSILAYAEKIGVSFPNLNL